MRASTRATTLVALVIAIVAAQEVTRRVVQAAVVVEAPARLSETGLYAQGRVGQIDPRNRPFSPQYPLWSDGASKARWIQLPLGTSIDTTNPGDWEFPVGTRLWKEFEFDGRKVETRLLWRASASQWVLASYIWNDEQTDALLAPTEGAPAVASVAPGKQHAVPSTSECQACHGTARVRPLGFTALQLSNDRDPLAIHAEALRPDMVTVATLNEEGALRPSRAEWVSHPPRIEASRPETRAVLGYLGTNCGSCHNGQGEIATLGPSWNHNDTRADGDAVVAAMLDHRTQWQVPGQTEGASVLLDSASPDASAMIVRMRSRRPSSQMPPLGSVVADREAIETIARWVGTQTH